MDTSEGLSLEFLDLSGVDEKEQIKLRISLQHNDPSVQLPWIKSNQKHTTDNKQTQKKPNVINNVPIIQPVNPNEYVPASMVSPPLVNNMYHNQVQHSHVVIPQIIQHPGYVIPPNMVCYASPPIQPTYSQPILIPSNAVHTFTPMGHYYSVVTTQQMATSVTHSDPTVMQHNGTIQLTVTEIENEDVEELESTAEDPNLTTNTTVSHENYVEPTFSNDEETVVSQPQPVIQNGLKTTNRPWASLFKSSNTTSKQNGFPSNNDMNLEKMKPVVENEIADTVCPIKHPKKVAQFVDPDCYRMGEFLNTYTVDGKAVSLQPRGLLNQSNYCYINSILQALIACPPLYNLLSGLAQNVSSNEKKKPTPVIDGMCRFVKEFKHLPPIQRVSNRRSDGKTQKKDQGVLINTDLPLEPTWIYKMIHGIQTDLIEGRQEDAEEFLGCLLNGLNDEMQELIKLVRNDCDDTNDVIREVETNRQGKSPKTVNSEAEGDDKEWQVIGTKNKGSVMRRTDFAKTPISDIFGGLLKSKIHRTGDHVTENIQPFFTLQLNIEKVKTVREALEALVSKNQLEGVTSSKTNEEVQAWQQVMLEELPVILVLHLKCFDFKLNGCTKIIKALEFPIDLKIEGKLLSSPKTQNPKEKQYKLFAVVYHDGKEASKGHYVTDAFHVGYSSWLRYDDASVKPIQEENVLKPQGTRVPYLLFYRRCDTIKSK